MAKNLNKLVCCEYLLNSTTAAGWLAGWPNLSGMMMYTTERIMEILKKLRKAVLCYANVGLRDLSSVGSMFLFYYHYFFILTNNNNMLKETLLILIFVY